MEYVDRFKLFAGLLIWLLAVTGGMAPLLGGRRVSKRVSSVLNMVAAGIFLASSCMHLLPDAQHNVALTRWGCEHTAELFLAIGGPADKHGEPRCFKWANFFYGCGFLLVLLLEVLAHSLQHKYTPHVAAHEAKPLLASETLRSPTVAHGSDSHGHSHGHSHSHELENGYGTQGADVEPSPSGDAEKAAEAVHSLVHEEHHSHSHGMVKGSPFLSLVVFLALSFHSVMEGMGMGASSGAAWDILVAILAHKSLAAFALTLEFLHHRASRSQLLTAVGIFSLMTPTGICLGRLLVDSNHATPASGICAALAGGTFLFVAMMEIIPQELQDPRFQLDKCAALLTGYCAMGVLSLWT